MMHARQQLGDAIRAAVTGLATTGARVVAGRAHVHDELPALKVYNDGEAVEHDFDTMGSEQHRRLVVVVEARAEDGNDLDGALETMVAEIEEAIYTDAALAALASDLVMESHEYDYTGDGDVPVGLVRVRWLVDYEVDEADPTTIIN